MGDRSKQLRHVLADRRAVPSRRRRGAVVSQRHGRCRQRRPRRAWAAVRAVCAVGARFVQRARTPVVTVAVPSVKAEL
eukprot:6033071-Prymnesium_polylepis.1